MTMQENSVSERAAEKLAAEMEAVKKDTQSKGFESTAIKYLSEPVGRMMMKFCYQNEEFALAVERCERPFIELLRGIVKLSGRDKPGISDVEAYAQAVKFYLPAGEVSCSFRVSLPEERDDDLIDLEAEIPSESGGAIILDLFGAEE